MAGSHTRRSIAMYPLMWLAGCVITAPDLTNWPCKDGADCAPGYMCVPTPLSPIQSSTGGGSGSTGGGGVSGGAGDAGDAGGNAGGGGGGSIISAELLLEDKETLRTIVKEIMHGGKEAAEDFVGGKIGKLAYIEKGVFTHTKVETIRKYPTPPALIGWAVDTVAGEHLAVSRPLPDITLNVGILTNVSVRVAFYKVRNQHYAAVTLTASVADSLVGTLTNIMDGIKW